MPRIEYIQGAAAIFWTSRSTNDPHNVRTYVLKTNIKQYVRGVYVVNRKSFYQKDMP